MRSRIVLDTRVSPDDRVHLVVRYSKNGRYRRVPADHGRVVIRQELPHCRPSFPSRAKAAHAPKLPYDANDRGSSSSNQNGRSTTLVAAPKRNLRFAPLGVVSRGFS
jgi:hypothetical protein